jgi:hypothetical protein
LLALFEIYKINVLRLIELLPKHAQIDAVLKKYEGAALDDGEQPYIDDDVASTTAEIIEQTSKYQTTSTNKQRQATTRNGNQQQATTINDKTNAENSTGLRN